MFSHSAGLLGAERALLATTESLIARGVEVVVVVPKHGPLVERLHAAGARVVRAPQPLWLARTMTWPVFLARAVAAFVALPRLFWITRGTRPCIAYTNSWVTPEGAVVARLLRVPHVWHIREFVPGNESLRTKLPTAFVRRCTESWSDEILAVSSSVAGQFSDDAPVQVVHAGIAPMTHERRAPHAWLRPGRPALLLLGSMSVAKGTPVAIDAVSALRSWLPDVRLLIVGSGSPRMVRALRETIDERGLGECVRIEDFTPDPQALFASSDIVLVPSRHEAYGLVTVEALAAGVPVVGTAAGGTKDLLAGGGGLLANVDDARHLAGHVHAIATDPALRGWLSERGRATAVALDPAAEAYALYDAIDRLCAQHQRGSKPAS